MGRKSLSEERTTEITQAFIRAVGKHGLDVSLEQVADEAGMSRSIIRHYIGNREDAMNTLITRITEGYLQELREANTIIPQPARVGAIMDYLFAEADSDEYEKLLFTALMSVRDRYPQARATLRSMMDEIIAMFAKDLRETFPAADAHLCQGTAFSIVALALSTESLLALGVDPSYNDAARRAAESLLAILESAPQPEEAKR